MVSNCRGRLGVTDFEIAEERSRRAADNPKPTHAVIATFGDDDTHSLVDAIEDAITGARAHAPQSLAPIAMLSHFYPTLRAAPIPMRVSMPALHRCCSIAWGGDADSESYASTTN